METAGLIVNIVLIIGLMLHCFVSYLNNKKIEQNKKYTDEISDTILKQFEEVKGVTESNYKFYVRTLRIILPRLEQAYSETNQFEDAAACRDLMKEVNKLCKEYEK